MRNFNEFAARPRLHYDFRIAEEVFASTPLLRRAVVFATLIDNQNVHPELSEALGAAVDSPRSHMLTNVSNDEVPTGDYKKRVQHGGHPDGNKAISTHTPVEDVLAIARRRQYRAIIDVDDLASVGPSLALRRASGSETFIPVDALNVGYRPDPGSVETERPVPGEIIYVDEATGHVLRRRWNWRRCLQTVLREHTTTAAITVDNFDADAATLVQRVATEIAEGLRYYCGATAQIGLLDPSRPTFEFQLVY